MGRVMGVHVWCRASLPPSWACPLCLQPGLLTTTRMCLAKSLELPIRKSEKAVCGRQRRHHLVTETFPHHLWQGPCGLGRRVLLGRQTQTHPGIEHLVPKAAVEFLWVGL